MNYGQIIKKIKTLGDPKNVESMARFGIKSKNTYGVSIPHLRRMAKEIGDDHALAQKLWASGIHEARILAGMIDAPALVTESQMDKWTKDFDSWDVCDQVCMNLFRWTKFAYTKAFAWSARKEEFVKRAGFALMASLAVGDKDAENSKFIKFLPIIKKQATDGRNFVKKAVNWSLRQIGKRNSTLLKKALTISGEISRIDSSAAKWIAADAIRELIAM